MDRIYTVCHLTQLMVVLHLRRHLDLPAAREFLIWHPLDGAEVMDRVMRQIVPAAGFDAVLDMRDFAGLQPRAGRPPNRWLAIARGYGRDALALRRWMREQGIEEADAELWTDAPMHFHAAFAKGLLRRARQVKLPHGFYLEDHTTLIAKARLVGKLRGSWMRNLFLVPALRSISGVDRGAGPALRYAEGYTFDQPSPWAPRSIDVSHLIRVETFRQTYESLPESLRTEVDAMLAPASAQGDPVLLLLLGPLSPSARHAYQSAMSRLFESRMGEFVRRNLVVKFHPGTAGGAEEDAFCRWLVGIAPCPVTVLSHPLNVEFLLGKVDIACVLGGPSGALPVLRKLNAGRVVVLAEVMRECASRYPQSRADQEKLVAGFEVW